MALRLRDRWKLWRWQCAGTPVTEPSCRRCGYPVRELTTAICPECGADRGVVGTIAPLPALRPHRWVVVAAWWMVTWAALWLLGPLVQPLVPRAVSYNEDYMLMPHSGLYGPFQL